jgi:hypothetical protein
VKYTVVWLPDVESHLAQLWMTAPDRSAVTKAGDEIDAQLRSKPHDVGEAAEGIYRVLAVEPLVVAYKVVDADRMVTVVGVICRS